jgi:hypothetical protein
MTALFQPRQRVASAPHSLVRGVTDRPIDPSHRRRAGVQSRYRILNERDVTIAREMYEAGQSLAAIGEPFGVADRTVLSTAAQRDQSRSRSAP